MITFKCKKCGKALGELTKGRLRKGTVLICADCYAAIEKKEMAQKFSDIGRQGDGVGNAVDNFSKLFGDLFPGKN